MIMKTGTLYICGTPIGNLEDITIRQLNTFKLVDFIACEDTRHTLKLLNRYEITKKLISFHEHNYMAKSEELIKLLAEGKSIALVSDAGMPIISDPGQGIVKKCKAQGITVTTVPGPTALISGFILSGLESNGFVFSGFFPKDKKGIKEQIEYLHGETKAVIYYEAPHRIKKTLAVLNEGLGGDREVSLVREITKIHEEALSDKLCNLVLHYEEREPKGEFVMIVSGVSQSSLAEKKQAEFADLTIAEHVEVYTEKGMSVKDAMKLAAKDRGISKREVYAVLNKDS